MVMMVPDSTRACLLGRVRLELVEVRLRSRQIAVAQILSQLLEFREQRIRTGTAGTCGRARAGAGGRTDRSHALQQLLQIGKRTLGRRQIPRLQGRRQGLEVLLGLRPNALVGLLNRTESSR